MRRPFPEFPTTLPEALERAAAHFPDRGIAIFDGRGRNHERRTYPEILASARRVAGRWQALGVEPGDRVLVSLPTSWEWAEAWLGALFCGALPVAIARGAALGAAEAHVRKLEAVVEHLTPRKLVVSAGSRQDFERLGARRALEALITSEELSAIAADPVPVPRPNSEEVAFLQLTSGSTGMVRAVAISHRSAIHNSAASDLGIGAPSGAPMHEWADAMVSWLPLHHDMGLVGCFFLPICCGLDLWLFQPSTILARPSKWLEHLGRHGATFAPAPNFGYQLCVERITEDKRRGLDLSSWRTALAGAEMVRPETVDAFLKAFGPHGFRAESFMPCYGLAEATLAVTFDQRGRGARTRPLPAGAEAERTASGLALSEVVCVGAPLDGLEVRIADHGGGELPDGEIGEVRVRGQASSAATTTTPKRPPKRSGTAGS